MKRGWYSFCFKPETITIVFTDKTFTYFKNGIETNSYAGAVAHGASKKIKKEFLYFNKYVLSYGQIIEKLDKRK